MKAITLNAGDLCTIVNALTETARTCDIAAGETRYVEVQRALEESAKQYKELAERIEAADVITVET